MMISAAVSSTWPRIKEKTQWYDMAWYGTTKTHKVDSMMVWYPRDADCVMVLYAWGGRSMSFSDYTLPHTGDHHRIYFFCELTCLDYRDRSAVVLGHQYM